MTDEILTVEKITSPVREGGLSRHNERQNEGPLKTLNTL